MPTHSRIMVCQKARRNRCSRTERGQTHQHRSHGDGGGGWGGGQDKPTELPHSFTGLRGEGFQAPQNNKKTHNTLKSSSLCSLKKYTKKQVLGNGVTVGDIASLGLFVPALAWTKALLTPKRDPEAEL